MYPSMFEDFGWESPKRLPEYSSWGKHFAWRKVVTVSGKKLWFKKCFKRSVTQRDPIKENVVTYEYATAFDLLKL